MTLAGRHAGEVSVSRMHNGMDATMVSMTWPALLWIRRNRPGRNAVVWPSSLHEGQLKGAFPHNRRPFLAAVAS